MTIGSLFRAVVKRLRRYPILLPVAVALGCVAAAVLAYLGTSNWWLTILAGLGAMIVMRVWWIVERQHIAEETHAAIISSSGDLTKAMNSLTLEVAELSIQVQTLSNEK